MNRKLIFRTLGKLLLVEAVFMLPSLFIGLLYHEEVLKTFLLPIGITAVCGLLLMLLRPNDKTLFARDGFLIVASGWVLICLFGALPFYFCGSFSSVWDCIFEIVSGFTTTGATVLAEVETLPHGILFWRSFSHWIGGMGVLVFVLAILPQSDDRSLYLMRAEVPGPVVGKLVPRMKDTAKILYGVYTALTLVLFILLLCSPKMDGFDAVCTAFGTAGTGGFSVRNASIASYDSVYIEMVLAVFMLLFGINFNLFYFVLIGKAKEMFKNEELRWYLSIIGLATVTIALNVFYTLRATYSLGLSFRYAFFQVCAIITTTGFTTVDFTTVFPQYSQHLLLLLMIIGATAGSTGGGLKTSRFILLCKSVAGEIKKLFHPRAVNVIRLEGKAVDNALLISTLRYFAMYFLIICCSTLIVSADPVGYDLTTNLSAVISCFNNIGPTLGNQIGATGNFGAYSPWTKILLSLDMLFGRLEILPMLILFIPNSWRSKN